MREFVFELSLDIFPVSCVRDKVERLSEQQSCLVQVYQAHVKPGPEHEGGHAGCEGPLGVAQMEPVFKERLDCEQSRHPEIVEMLEGVLAILRQVRQHSAGLTFNTGDNRPEYYLITAPTQRPSEQSQHVSVKSIY